MKKKSKMTVGAQLIMTLGLMMLSMFIVGACGYLMRNNSVETETELYENYGKTQGEAAMGFAQFQEVKVQLRNVRASPAEPASATTVLPARSAVEV